MGSQAKIVNFAEITANFELTPQQALEYFLGKGVKPTFNWADMMGAEHDTAFTVAKMMDTDLLATVKGKLDKALESGMTLQQFQKDLIPTLQKAGWWGKKDLIDPLTGYVTQAQLGSASRLETIFRSNMQSAYQVGTWEGIEDNKKLYPWLMYDAVDDARTRPDHAARDGEIHAVDSDFWATHYPPNGYNCRCGVIPMDEEEAIESGLYNPTKPIQTEKWTNPRNGKVYDVPTDVDPGWDHNPGKARKKSIEATAAEKAKTLGAAEQAAIKKAQATQQTAKVAYEKTIQESLLEAQDALEAAQAKYPTLQAQGKIAKALSANTPYLSSEIKKLQGVVSDPIELIAKAEAKALKSEQNSMVQTWKQAKKKGKLPSDKANAYVKTLPDEVQASLNAEIDQFTGATAAKLELEKIAIGKADKQAGLKKKLFDKYSKDGTASQYATNPKGLLAKIEKDSQALQDKAELSSNISLYKQKVLAGKIPSPKQIQAFDSLDEAGKLKVIADIDKKQATGTGPQGPIKATTPDPAPKPTGAPLNVDRMQQVGGQGGSNLGGTFLDPDTGIKWYIKQPNSTDQLRNELLAGKFYQKAGIETPELELATWNGKPAIASKIIDGLESDRGLLTKKAIPGVQDGFVMDAWLANWDVVGLGFDNLLVKAGRAIRVDTGGALRYRAQGNLKGSSWNNNVDELESLLDPGANSQAASVFGKLTREQKIESARRVLAFTDKDIADLVNTYGPLDKSNAKALIATLKARRDKIGEIFPEARVQPQAATTAGARIDRIEMENIRNSRANGYSVRTDVDQIEDQNVLIWHKQGADGTGSTGAYLKLRGDAQEALAKRFNLTATDTGPAYNYAKAGEKLLLAIKSIKYRIDEGTKKLEGTGLDKVKGAIAEYDDLAAQLKKEVAAGRRTQAEVDYVLQQFVAPMTQLRKSVRTGKPTWDNTIGKWSAPEISDALPDPRAAGSIFAKSKTYKYNRSRLERGFQNETGEVVEISTPVYEANINGALVRYFPNEDGSYNALKGRLEINVPGQEIVSAEKIFEVLDELGINSARATALDQERLYLQQLGYIHKVDNKPPFKKALTNGDFTKAKAMISDKAGVDIDNVHYKPEGAHQAFQHGRTVRERPEILGHPGWGKFQDDYIIGHSITGGLNLEKLKQIISGGGQMAPTTDKFRRGIPMGGMSPVQDLSTGGASYFFTRLMRSRNSTADIAWKSKIAARTDAIHYNGDKYGRTFNNIENKAVTGRQTYVQRTRQTSLDEMTADLSSRNEMIFKDSLSLFDDLLYIRLPPSDRDAFIKWLRQSPNNYKEWPDGRPLEEVIIS